MGFRGLKKAIVIFAVLLSVFYGAKKIYPEGLDSITGHTSYAASKIPEEKSREPIVLFCPRDSCGMNLEYMINKSEKVHCAFFDLGLENVISALERKDALTVVDGDNYRKEWENNTNFRKDNRKAYMHNKFCIFDDETVWTGSFNPTPRSDTKSNNNVVIISSKALAKNYEDEFQELWNGYFGKGKKTENPIVKLGDGTIVESYFCPEDYCANVLMANQEKTNQSLYFMLFSFTHSKIGDLVKDIYIRGKDVKGVFEKRQNSKYSQYSKLNETGIDARLDTNPYDMHHKVWIIDKNIVITGSFNPTLNGDTQNDENMLIIRGNKNVTNKFLAEFYYVYGK